MTSGTADAATPAPARRRRRRLAVDLTVLGLIGVLLVGAIGAGVATLYRQFYSPTAFVEHYLDLLADGRAADALSIPGVAVDSVDLDAAGLASHASDALLRRDALGSLKDVEITSETQDGDTTRIGVSYQAGGYPGSTTFDVVRDGSVGLAPIWRFAKSPLALMELTVQGSMTFDVNHFSLDKRQVSPDGIDADPKDPVALLVFSPGLYSVSVDSAISATPGVAVLSDSPFTEIPIDVKAAPTDEFISVVQDRVSEFLDECATQEVLQPTGCPFGYVVQDRIETLPTWKIIEQPVVEVEPDGESWRIPATDAMAQITVAIQSLYDGTITQVRQEVPFEITGTITVLPDGKVSIAVTGLDAS